MTGNKNKRENTSKKTIEEKKLTVSLSITSDLVKKQNKKKLK